MGSVSAAGALAQDAPVVPRPECAGGSNDAADRAARLPPHGLLANLGVPGDSSDETGFRNVDAVGLAVTGPVAGQRGAVAAVHAVFLDSKAALDGSDPILEGYRARRRYHVGLDYRVGGTHIPASRA